VFRIWTFLAGLPLGVLGFLALPGPSPTAALGCLLAGGLGLTAAASLAGRIGSHVPDRGRHLTRASSLAWAAVPAAAAAWLGLGPGVLVSLAALVAALGLSLFLAARASGPGAGGLGQVAAVLASVLGGALAFTAWGAALAWWTAQGTSDLPPESRSRYVYDLDARAPTAPLPDCDGSSGPLTTLAHGARPALGADGFLWFDAPGPEGRRQIHRRDPATGEIDCFTCGQEGNNLRPRPAIRGQRVVFETDRHVGPLRPIDRDLYLLTAAGPPPAVRLQRLTTAPDPDVYGELGPGGNALVWSAAREGGWAVTTAAVETGHGGIAVGATHVLVAGGTSWVAPLAWSPDARSLVLLGGDPRRLGSALLLDPATGERSNIELGEAHVAGAAFSADGGVLAVVSTRPSAWARSVPSGLGFLLARASLFGSQDGPVPLRDTALHVGHAGGGGWVLVQLGEAGGWGYPTGVALAPDGRRVYLGQRAGCGADAEERILELELCP
jgi:hypothetical protein